MVTFTAGELFNSFGDLQQKLSDYSEEHYCHFYIKDSKKLSPEEIVNPNLIYKHIVYSCIYGGQKPRFRGSGSRSVTSIRHGCPASLYLRVTKDRTHLQVRSFVSTHSHEISEEVYRSAAQDKKLPWDLKAEVEELLLLGADKERLCEYIRHVSKKTLDKKNLFNMYETAVRQQREISRERAVMLIQKAYGVDTEVEAEQILQQLLDSSRPTRRSRKSEQDMGENVQYTYVNEGDESQDGEEVGEELQRLMGSLSGPDGDRIVIVQGDEQFEVIEADNSMEEYLEDDDKDGEGHNVVVKQENKEDEGESEGDGARFVVTQPRPTRKRPNPASKERTIIYEPPAKTRIVSGQFAEAEGSVVAGTDEISDAKLTNLRAELEKLTSETEVLKLKRNKIVRDISKLDLEKSKLYLEIDLLKQNKKYVTDKTNWLASDLQTKELKNEKLKLEIAKLKIELNEN